MTIDIGATYGEWVVIGCRQCGERLFGGEGLTLEELDALLPEIRAHVCDAP